MSKNPEAMDKEQQQQQQMQMQFLGFSGVYKEASRIILSWREIFTQITFKLILPLSVIFFAHIQVSVPRFTKIQRGLGELYNKTNPYTPQYNKLCDIISSEVTSLWAFEVAFFTSLLVLTILSTTTVVNAVSSIYTAKDATFEKAMSVVPAVWMRLMYTILCGLSVFPTYSILSLFAGLIIVPVTPVARNFVIGLTAVLYFIGLVCLTVVCQLASVVTVLEDSSGFEAMERSMALIWGKKRLSILILFTHAVPLVGITIFFEKMVVMNGRSESFAELWAHVFICFLLLSCLFLLWLVVQTVFYFVCKSYYNENIDESALADQGRLKGKATEARPGSTRVSAKSSLAGYVELSTVEI